MPHFQWWFCNIVNAVIAKSTIVFCKITTKMWPFCLSVYHFYADNTENEQSLSVWKKLQSTFVASIPQVKKTYISHNLSITVLHFHTLHLIVLLLLSDYVGTAALCSKYLLSNINHRRINVYRWWQIHYGPIHCYICKYIITLFYQIRIYIVMFARMILLKLIKYLLIF